MTILGLLHKWYAPLNSEHVRDVRGFSVLELMIVLVIILTAAAIMAASALASCVRANEVSALNVLKTIQGASLTYRVTQDAYPSSLSSLDDGYLSGGSEAREKSGYRFELRSASDGESFTCTAVPKRMNITGVRSYCTSDMNATLEYANAPALRADGTECPPGGVVLTG